MILSTHVFHYGQIATQLRITAIEKLQLRVVTVKRSQLRRSYGAFALGDDSINEIFLSYHYLLLIINDLSDLL